MTMGPKLRRPGPGGALVLALLGAACAMGASGCTTVNLSPSPAAREAELALTSPLRAEARRFVSDFQARKWTPVSGNALGALANVLLSGGEAGPHEAPRPNPLEVYLAEKVASRLTPTALGTALDEDLRLALRDSRSLNRAAETELKAKSLSPLWREELTDLERAAFALDRAAGLFGEVRERLAAIAVAPDGDGPDFARIDIDRAHLSAEHDRMVALSEALAMRGGDDAPTPKTDLPGA